MPTDIQATTKLFKVIDRRHPSIISNERAQGTLAHCEAYIASTYTKDKLNKLPSMKKDNIAAYFYNSKGLEVVITEVR